MDNINMIDEALAGPALRVCIAATARLPECVGLLPRLTL